MLHNAQKCCYIATNRVYSRFDATKCYIVATLHFPPNSLIINDAHNVTDATCDFCVLSSILIAYRRKKASDRSRTPLTTN